jgi:hypothetical protein
MNQIETDEKKGLMGIGLFGVGLMIFITLVEFA